MQAHPESLGGSRRSRGVWGGPGGPEAVMSSLLLLFPSPASFKLSHPQNVSKGDFPMALLPDPTTAAFERSSVKKVQNSQQNEFKRG